MVCSEQCILNQSSFFLLLFQEHLKLLLKQALLVREKLTAPQGLFTLYSWLCRELRLSRSLEGREAREVPRSMLMNKNGKKLPV